SRRIPGWTAGEEAVALGRASQALPAGAVVVEIGSFLGKSAVILAGARKLRGSGCVHCVGTFDASGDAFSAPVYRRLAQSSPASLRERFDGYIRGAGLEGWVKVHHGGEAPAAAAWTAPIDLLFMDADHGEAAVRAAYARWAPFVKDGGIIAIHNSRT